MNKNWSRNFSLTIVLVPFLVTQLSLPARADDIAGLDQTGIDSRELELRRKEQELLRTINLTATDIDTNSNSEPRNSASQNSHEEDLGVGNEGLSAKALEISAPEPAREPQRVEEAPRQTHTHQAHALKELAHHPALTPRQKSKPARALPSNEVRTKSYDEFPDGTTAKRVGTFYRINRPDDYENPRKGTGQERTIPIQDYHREPTVRPALLSSDELATIGSSSTFLRIGPSRFDSTLMKIPQYTEVVIDYRSGTWYRVATSTGVRGWVQGSELLFENGISPRSSVKVRGVTTSLR